MIEGGPFNYNRITYQAGDDPFHSGTFTEKLTLKKVVSLVTTYLKRIRSSPRSLMLYTDEVWSELGRAYVHSSTGSEMWVDKDTPFTEEEFQEFVSLVENEWKRRGYPE